MQVKELGHVVLFVRDIKISTYFYRDILGWRLIYDGPQDPVPSSAVAFNAPGGRTHHELLLIEVGSSAAPLPNGRRIGMCHFGVKVGDSDDELREALDVLIAHDVKVLGATDHGMSHSLYILDPDGNELELYIDVPGVNVQDPKWWTDFKPSALHL
ncbi:MAG: VOC family protein [Actinomycetota bacterium]|nr:VOC family protein [Actinomycetota bacterium]